MLFHYIHYFKILYSLLYGFQKAGCNLYSKGILYTICRTISEKIPENINVCFYFMNIVYNIIVKLDILKYLHLPQNNVEFILKNNLAIFIILSFIYIF